MICKISGFITIIAVVIFGIWYCINYEKLNTENINVAENTEIYAKNSIDKSEDLEENNSYKIININNASYYELISLPNIGDKTANKIIDYRNKNNGFKSVEEIMNIDGVGQKTYDEIKKYLTIQAEVE